MLAAGRMTSELQSLAPSAHAEQLQLADRIASLCWDALEAEQPSAQGLSPLRTRQALGAALELSALTLTPLLQIHERATELSAGAVALPTDAFLAHQARFVAPSLVEWTQELLQDAPSAEAPSSVH